MIEPTEGESRATLDHFAAVMRQSARECEASPELVRNAPQQQVVNGWVAKDLLTVIAEQQSDSVTDERLPALAVLVVLATAWFMFQARISSSAAPSGQSDSPIAATPAPLEAR